MGFGFFIIVLFQSRFFDGFSSFLKEKLDQVLNLNMDNTPSPVIANHGYENMLF